MAILITLCAYIQIAFLFIWIVSNCIFLYLHHFKCMDIKYCSNKKCKYKNLCHRYGGDITREEAEMLLEFLDSL